jgi:predicted MFS family arabinose efflux permease
MHGVALAFLVAFLWRQLTTRRPLIQLRLLRIPRLSAGVVANGIAHSSMLATGLLIPFLLERGRGYSPTETAELLLVQQVSLVIGSFGGGWLYSRRATPVLGVGSIAAIALGLAVLGQVGAGLPLLGLFPLSALLGAGLGVFTAVNNTAVMSSISGDQRGFASGLVETTRQLGHSLGVSIASGVLATSLVAATDPAAGYLQGFSEAASVMGVVAAIGVLVVVYPLVRTAFGVSRPAALR